MREAGAGRPERPGGGGRLAGRPSPAGQSESVDGAAYGADVPAAGGTRDAAAGLKEEARQVPLHGHLEPRHHPLQSPREIQVSMNFPRFVVVRGN